MVKRSRRQPSRCYFPSSRPSPGGRGGAVPASSDSLGVARSDFWEVPRGTCAGGIRNQSVGNVDGAVGAGGHPGIVRHQQDGDALAVETPEHPQNLLPRPRIEVARRFIGQNERRVIHQRAGDGNPLLLAAGHLRRLMLLVRGQPYLGEQRLGQPLGLAAGGPPQGIVQGHEHVVQGRCPWQEVEALEDEAQLRRPHHGPLVGSQAAHLPAIEPVTARSWAIEAAQDVHERGLAGAGSPHQGYHFAVGDGQGDTLEHRHVHFAQTVGSRDVLQADERAGAGCAVPCRRAAVGIGADCG